MEADSSPIDRRSSSETSLPVPESSDGSQRPLEPELVAQTTIENVETQLNTLRTMPGVEAFEDEPPADAPVPPPLPENGETNGELAEGNETPESEEADLNAVDFGYIAPGSEDEARARREIASGIEGMSLPDAIDTLLAMGQKYELGRICENMIIAFGPAAVPVLVERLADASGPTANLSTNIIAQLLTRYPPDAVAPVLKERLAAADNPIARVRLLDSLRDFEDEANFALRAGLEDAAPVVRLRMLQSLSPSDRFSAEEKQLIRGLLGDGDEEVRIAAAFALRRQGVSDDRIPSIIRSALSKEPDGQEIVSRIEGKALPDAIDTLLGIVNASPNPRADNAIGTCRDIIIAFGPAAVPVLVERLADASGPATDFIETMLSDFPPDAVAPVLKERLAAADNPIARVRLLDSLRDFEDEANFALRAGLEDAAPVVRLAMMRSLYAERLSPEDEELVRGLLGDGDEEVRIEAAVLLSANEVSDSRIPLVLRAALGTNREGRGGVLLSLSDTVGVQNVITEAIAGLEWQGEDGDIAMNMLKRCPREQLQSSVALLQDAFAKAQGNTKVRLATVLAYHAPETPGVAGTLLADIATLNDEQFERDLAGVEDGMARLFSEERPSSSPTALMDMGEGSVASLQSAIIGNDPVLKARSAVLLMNAINGMPEAERARLTTIAEAALVESLGAQNPAAVELAVSTFFELGGVPKSRTAARDLAAIVKSPQYEMMIRETALQLLATVDARAAQQLESVLERAQPPVTDREPLPPPPESGTR